MQAGIGASTTEVASADEVRRFKGRTLARRSDEDAMARAGRRGHHARSPEPLSTLCLRVMAECFATRPLINRVPSHQVTQLTSMLDLNLDIEVAAANIYDENYWRRKALAENWKHLEIAHHGLTWKQLYFEKKIQQLLEDFIPDEELAPESKLDDIYEDDEDDFDGEHGESKRREPSVSEEVILAHLRAGQDYVFQLNISQLLSHIDVHVLFRHLSNLSRFCLTYGVRHVGMKYDRSLFGIKMSDTTSLARCLKETHTLTTLALPSNLIDDDLLRMLMSGLVSNETVTSLDLSHNKITNHGVRLIAKLLGPKSILTSLDLSNNALHVEAGRFLGRALRRNSSLLELNLRLNRLSDEGGSLIFEGLQSNSALSILNVSCNSLGERSAQGLATALATEHSALTAVDVSCNDLSEEDGQQILQVLERECRLVSLDLRKNMLEESAAAIGEIVKKVELQVKRSGMDAGAFK